MIFIELPNYAEGRYKAGTGSLYGIAGPQFFLRFSGKYTADKFAKQLGEPVPVNSTFWDDCARAAAETSNNAGYRGIIRKLAEQKGH